MKYFPLFIKAHDTNILIYGGGEDAAAKLRLVQKTDAKIHVIAERIAKSELQLGSATWHQSEPLNFTPPKNVAFAYAATGDKKLDAQIANDLRAKGILVCAADQPSVSDFTTPAIVDRDPVVVAIGTEGTAPVLARNLKSEFETLLVANLGRTANLAATLRSWVAMNIAGGLVRRRFWQAFFKQSPKNLTQARALAVKLKVPTAETHGQLILVGAGPGDPEHLTFKAKKALESADVVIHSNCVSSAVMELPRREALTVPLKPDSLMQDAGGQDAGGQVTAAIAEGLQVVWVSANTPIPADILTQAQIALLQDKISVVPGVPVEALQIPQIFPQTIFRKAA